MSSKPVSFEFERIAVIDFLRGFAALGVCWFHFTQGNPDFLPPGLLKASGYLGTFGAELFFVVSGFILPYTMLKRSYQARTHFGAFMGKRVARLHPPYLAAIAVFIVLWWLSSLVPGFAGEPVSVSAGSLFSHFTYTSWIAGYDFINPVLWALTIEMQFYLFIAATFALVSHPRGAVRYGYLLALVACAFLPVSRAFLVPWLPLFALGLATYQYLTRQASAVAYAVLSVVSTVAAGVLLGGDVALAALTSALAIAFVRVKMPRPFVWVGMVSYSLYLFHLPVGGRIINLSSRLESALGVTGEAAFTVKVGMLALAVGASIVAAYVGYRMVEKPAHRWASRITYRSPAEEATAAPLRAA